MGEMCVEVIQIIKNETAKVDLFKMYDVDHYLNAMGLCVNSNFRGRVIATEMLRSRAPRLLKCLGLKLTACAFTVTGTQKAGAVAGYKDVYVRSYSDMTKEYLVDFSKNKTENFKVMALDI